MRGTHFFPISLPYGFLFHGCFVPVSIPIFTISYPCLSLSHHGRIPTIEGEKRQVTRIWEHRVGVEKKGEHAGYLLYSFQLSGYSLELPRKGCRNFRKVPIVTRQQVVQSLITRPSPQAAYLPIFRQFSSRNRYHYLYYPFFKFNSDHDAGFPLLVDTPESPWNPNLLEFPRPTPIFLSVKLFSSARVGPATNRTDFFSV